MKKYVLFLIVIVALLSSCMTSRVGCPGPQQHWVGCGGYR